MKVQSTPAKENLQQRLRRIEGQVRGVHKMLDDERDCHEILQQLTAIHSAVRNAADVFMRTYAKECLARLDPGNERERDDMIDDLLDLMAKVH